MNVQCRAYTYTGKYAGISFGVHGPPLYLQVMLVLWPVLFQVGFLHFNISIGAKKYFAGDI